jgi:hypothetical protein
MVPPLTGRSSGAGVKESHLEWGPDDRESVLRQEEVRGEGLAGGVISVRQGLLIERMTSCR